MRGLIALAVLALPLYAAAGPTLAPSSSGLPYVLKVEYWGTSFTASPGGRVFGDSVHGTFHADLRLAPPDASPYDPASGAYEYNEDGYPPRVPAPSGFVTSDSQPRIGVGESEDRVFVYDVDAHPTTGFTDSFTIANREFFPDGDDLLDVDFGASQDFIHGDGLLQSFDVTRSASDPAYDLGTFSKYADGVRRVSYFVVDRLRVTPKFCGRP